MNKNNVWGFILKTAAAVLTAIASFIAGSTMSSL